jgi:hypothetical protein
MNKEKLIGKTFKEAQEMLRNCVYRIVSQDGENYMLTMDYNINRYNLSLIKGVVTEVTFG